MYQILLFLSYYQIVSLHFQIVSVLVISNPCPIFHLIILFSYLNQILSTLSNAFNGSCINSLSAFSNLSYYHRMPYYLWAAFRGILSYHLIVLFSYFQSLGRFLGALYHIIIGLFWGAFFLLSYYHWAAFWHLLSYCSIIIGPILVGFFLIVLLSLGLL